LNDISTGASNDIQRATQIARDMVTKYGMSDNLGTVFYDSDNEEVFIGRDFGHAKNYSEEVAAQIDKEVRSLIDESYDKCELLLNENMAKLHVVAQRLLEKEKIDGEEFEDLFTSI
jgi:cell division protease FtsH